MIDHRDAQDAFRDGVGVGALAREEERAELRQVGLLDECALRVFALDRADRRGRREHRRHAIALDDVPVDTRVRRPHRFAFEEDRGRAEKERRVDDVGVAHDPADVGGRPPHVAGFDAVDVAQAPGERDQVPAVVAHHALGDAGRPRGVEDVERIGRGHRGTGNRAPARLELHPIEVPPHDQVRLELLALEHHAVLGFGAGELDRPVEQRFVGDHPIDLDPTGCGQHELGLGVVDPGRQLFGGEATEDDRVDRADSRTGEHGHRRFGNHRQIDQDAIALADPELLDGPGETRHAVEQGLVGDHFAVTGGGTFVDDRRVVPAPRLDVAVDRVVAGVAHAVGEPAVEGRPARVQGLGRRFEPVHRLGRFRPERLALVERTPIDRFQLSRLCRLSCSSRHAVLVLRTLWVCDGLDCEGTGDCS